MNRSLQTVPMVDIVVNSGKSVGPFEAWRHTFSHGGINVRPLPDRVADGLKQLRPRLIRTFLQQYLDIYPRSGTFDWSRLDPYMASLARTGASVVAAITLKPPVLYPTIDAAVWQPTDVEEWQRIISALVHRYSVEQPIVTYWEIGNETDIGENGGSPFLIPDPESYFAFYQMTIAPILQAFPQAKVGGPAACWIDNEPLPGLLRLCHESGTQLDFISWHLYSDDPARHGLGVERAKALLAPWGERRPEMLITEWSKGFEHTISGESAGGGRPLSVEDAAFEPRRAAIVAASIRCMLDAGLDWSFYYHVWDQVFLPDDFRPFFSDHGLQLMITHWNEIPHRFGLFGVEGEVRPQYFVFWMLHRLGEERLHVEVSEPELHVLAGHGDGQIAVLAANLNQGDAADRVVNVRFDELAPGSKVLTTYRIDAGRHWDSETLQLIPIEQREIWAFTPYHCQVFVPADSVVLLQISDKD